MKLFVTKSDFYVYVHKVNDGNICTKTDFATKLDSNTSGVAKTLKHLGIYTKNNKVTSKFKEKYNDVNLIDIVYRRGNDGVMYADWQWLGEGTIKVIQELLEHGCAYETENGFKLAGLNELKEKGVSFK